MSDQADSRTVKSFCRICQGYCAVDVDIEDGRIVRVRGDRSDPVTRGFTCFKGLQAPEQYHGPGRLRTSLRRGPDGRREPVPSETALAEITERLGAIVAESGPEAVGFYVGTQASFGFLGWKMQREFAKAIGSPRTYGTMTIDQSAKWVADARIGTFGSGWPVFGRSDVWMLIGTNPVVSLLGGVSQSGFALHNPVKTLKDARETRQKLIVIDPRRSETAAFADLFIQPRPGCDAHIMAALLNIVLGEGWHDAAFCAEHVDHLEALRAGVAPFTPAAVAAYADIPEAQLHEAAQMFARDARTGRAGSGTGPDMGPFSNLAEHLIQALNIVCGRFLKAGEAIPNPGVLGKPYPRRAEASAPCRTWEKGPRSRRLGLGTMNGQMMTMTLPDEILQPGPGRLRALICMGGNPAVAIPDEIKTREALSQLDLLVTIDPRLSETAKLAHYVVAPTLFYERPDHTGMLEIFFSDPYANYTPAIVEPGPEFDVVHDWYVFWRIARGLGLDLVPGFEARTPTSEELLAHFARGSRTPLEQVRSRRGAFYEVEAEYVAPAGPGAARLDLVAEDVAQELRDLATDLRSQPLAEPGFPLRLIVRRRREVMNSAGADFAALQKKFPRNPAYLHPDDAARLSLTPGQAVRVRSSRGEIAAFVEVDETLRPGVVSMTHCWPNLREDGDPDGTTSLLIDAEADTQTINGMPVMTAVPVRVTAA